MAERAPKSRSKKQRHDPLGQQILADDAPRVRYRKSASKDGEDEDGSEKFVDARMSQKILQMSHEQQLEESVLHKSPFAAGSKHKKNKGAHTDDDNAAGDDDDDDDDAEAMASDAIVMSGREEDGAELFEHLDINPGDERVLAQFMPAARPNRQTLADVIMGKIRDAQTEIASQHSHAAAPVSELNPKVAAVFQSVGRILATYRSGKLPKAFKIIPTLRNWEEVLFATEPDAWTAAAMYQATRIFASNLNAKMAQRFFALVLMPRVRDDIAEFHRLNFHLYMALKKALFKPAAFFKGILLPICEAGDCTLREAVIISSALARTSIPVLHASAAMLKIAEMPYTGANSIFLRVLLDKKYALPFRVIDALVFHFVRFTPDKREMPVLWHQALLVFVQRYKEDVAAEQKEALLALLRAHTHPLITPDIRREIVQSRSRDNEMPLGEHRLDEDY